MHGPYPHVKFFWGTVPQSPLSPWGLRPMDVILLGLLGLCLRHFDTCDKDVTLLVAMRGHNIVNYDVIRCMRLCRQVRRYLRVQTRWHIATFRLYTAEMAASAAWKVPAISSARMYQDTQQCNTHIQYNTIQYNTIQYNTIQCNAMQYNTIQYNTIQCNTIQYNTIQFFFLLFCFISKLAYLVFLFFTSIVHPSCGFAAFCYWKRLFIAHLRPDSYSTFNFCLEKATPWLGRVRDDWMWARHFVP